MGGFVADGSSSRQVDVYSPATGRWSRLPDVPRAVNHTFAAAWRGKLYVAGGYGPTGRLRTAWVLDAGRWRPLPTLPYGLAAGGAAVVGSRLYLVGGVAGLPENRFATVTYESLVADTAGTIEQLYNQLELGPFDAVRETIVAETERRRGYRAKASLPEGAWKDRIHSEWAPILNEYAAMR